MGFARFLVFGIFLFVIWVVYKKIFLPMVKEVLNQSKQPTTDSLTEKNQTLKNRKRTKDKVEKEIEISEELVDVSAELSVKKDKLEELDMVLDAQEQKE